MRIAFVISGLGRGGAERQLVNFVNALPDNVEVDLFVLRDDLELANELHHPQVTLHAIGLRSRADVLGWAKLASALRASHADVVHSHMLLANLATRCLKEISGHPILINHEHGLSLWKHPLLRSFDRASHGLADWVLTVSEASRQHRLQREGLHPAKVEVLPNALAWEEWQAVQPAPSAPAATWGLAARLIPLKRVDLALRLLRVAKEMGSKARLRIAGDGPERQALEQLTARLELTREIEFLGAQANMKAFYSSVDVVLLTSEIEDCPMALLEGLASGKYLVATAVGGVPELVASAPDAMLLDENDLEACANRLTKISGGFDSKGNRALAKRYDIRSYVSRLLNLYEAELRRRDKSISDG